MDDSFQQSKGRESRYRYSPVENLFADYSVISDYFVISDSYVIKFIILETVEKAESMPMCRTQPGLLLCILEVQERPALRQHEFNQ